MQSERVIVEAPLSFVGATRRVWRLSGNVFVRILLLAPLVALAWLVVAAWYVFFGIWLIPYRILRRGQRRRKQEMLRHRELIGARHE